MKNIIFSILFLSIFAACKKTPVEETDKPLGDMELKSISGRVWKDTLVLCNNPNLVGRILADNEYIITGSNFGEDGQILISNPKLEFHVQEWTNDSIIIQTSCSDLEYEFKEPVELTILRADGKSLKRALKVVNDIQGYAQFTPIWYMLQFYERTQKVIPDDFHQNMEPCTGDYEPEQYDIVLIKNEWNIITSVPILAESDNSKRYTFQIGRADCNGNEIESYAEYKTIDGFFIDGVNSPKSYFRN